MALRSGGEAASRRRGLPSAPEGSWDPCGASGSPRRHRLRAPDAAREPGGSPGRAGRRGGGERPLRAGFTGRVGVPPPPGRHEHGLRLRALVGLEADQRHGLGGPRRLQERVPLAGAGQGRGRRRRRDFSQLPGDAVVLRRGALLCLTPLV